MQTNDQKLSSLGISESDYSDGERAKLIIEYEKLILEKQKIAHSRWWQEDALVNNRVTWLLQSQILLFAAYGLIARNSPVGGEFSQEFNALLAALPWLGFGIGLVITLGIHAAWSAQKVLFNLYSPQGMVVGVHDVTTTVGRIPGRALPLLFAAGWGWIRWGYFGAAIFVTLSLLVVFCVDWLTKKHANQADT